MRRLHRSNWVRGTIAIYLITGAAIFLAVLLLMHVITDRGWPFLVAAMWGVLMPLGTLGIRLSTEKPWRRTEEAA